MVDISRRVDALPPDKRALFQRLLAEKRNSASPGQVISRRPAGDAPLSFAQERLWFLDHLQPGNPFYNMPAAVHLAGSLDVAALQRSLNEIVRRHEALRTTFVPEGGGARQVIGPAVPASVPVVDLQAIPAVERKAAAMRLAEESIRQPFDLTRGPLL